MSKSQKAQFPHESARPAGDVGKRPGPAGSTPRLYLATPPVTDAAKLAEMLAPALKVVDVAAVLLRLAPSDERTLIERTKHLAAEVQALDVALVLDGHPDIVARSGADGAHLTGIEAFIGVINQLKPARIVGCGGLRTRHDAMVAAEQGADYVMFGEPHDGRRAPYDEIVERIAWWADLFEVPCIGYAGSHQEIAKLAQLGADFIAVGEWVFAAPEGLAASLVAINRALHAEALS